MVLDKRLRPLRPVVSLELRLQRQVDYSDLRLQRRPLVSLGMLQVCIHIWPCVDVSTSLFLFLTLVAIPLSLISTRRKLALWVDDRASLDRFVSQLTCVLFCCRSVSVFLTRFPFLMWQFNRLWWLWANACARSIR